MFILSKLLYKYMDVNDRRNMTLIVLFKSLPKQKLTTIPIQRFRITILTGINKIILSR